MVPTKQEILRKADPAIRLRAVNLLGQWQDLNERYAKTDGYRSQINYPYWQMLAQAEQEERTVRARRLVYEAEQANRQAELDKAIDLYEQAFEIWAEIFDDYPILTVDDTAEDLYESIRRYMVLKDSEELSDDFPLKVFVEIIEDDFGQADLRRYAQRRAEFEAAAKKRKQELEQQQADAEAETDP